MEQLYNTFRLKLSLTPMDYIREFHDKINWSNRLICIMGQKGVGKSTMLLQHIKKFDNLEETLYVTADNIYFSGHTLYDLAQSFFKAEGSAFTLTKSINTSPGQRKSRTYTTIYRFFR